jgi:branched-chain amino acid transport system substrate-binding protein
MVFTVGLHIRRFKPYRQPVRLTVRAAGSCLHLPLYHRGRAIVKALPRRILGAMRKPALLLMILAFAACRTPPPREPEPEPPTIQLPRGPKNPITIGVVAPLSGPYARTGVSERNGVELAIGLANRRGGLFNADVGMVVDDGACEELQGKAKAKWLISVEEVKFIIGEICAVSTIPATDLADEEGALMMSPVSTEPRVTLRAGGSVKPFVFRTCMMNPLQGRIAARFAMDHLGKNTAAVIFNRDSSHSRECAEAFIARFTSLGGKIAVKQDYSAEQVDYADSVKVIGASRAEVLYIPDEPRAVNRIAAQAKKLGVSPVFIGADRWESGGLYLSDVEGAYFTTQFSAEDTRPAVREFVEEYSGSYGARPDAAACLSFDAALILLSAIQAAGTSDPALVRDVLEKGTWNAVTGPVSFDAEHNPIKPGAVMQVKKGKVVFAAAVAP